MATVLSEFNNMTVSFNISMSEYNGTLLVIVTGPPNNYVCDNLRDLRRNYIDTVFIIANGANPEIVQKNYSCLVYDTNEDLFIVPTLSSLVSEDIVWNVSQRLCRGNILYMYYVLCISAFIFCFGFVLFFFCQPLELRICAWK